MIHLIYFLFFGINFRIGLSTFEQLNLRKNESSYNKFDFPRLGERNYTGGFVEIFIHVESLREITSETTMDFYLVQFWTDPRLTDRQEPLKVTGRVLPDTVWYPDTYFLLVRSLLYSPEEQYVVFTNNGSVEYNRKVRLKTPCSPNVMLFPFDVVTCSLVLSSFGYTANEVEYRWKYDAVKVDEKNNNVDHLGFYLQGKSILQYNIPYADANYSALKTVVYLKRKHTAYLMQVYFPAALIVILSWSIFWINLQATPARASLGVTTVLTMLTLATQSTSQNAKHVNGKVTAIDMYLWACFVFVIFAMLEFALSDFTIHNPKKKNESPSRQSENLETVLVLASDEDEENFRDRSSDSQKRIRKIENGNSSGKVNTFGRSRGGEKNRGEGPERLGMVNSLARVLFPLCFFLFNLTYWSTLLFMINKHNSVLELVDH
ncbi:gamma-aminobutyric acid receptor subunit beta-like [Convolutriloba macropyga]|uniref:gamma-aminobutyric acid receptor subunit beta-like n=1 Tax=Convolutriloba macropyga TaxID=536237 RepID=UPI003F5254C5